MSVAIEKLEDVESVKVSLNDGTASVVLRPGNSLDPEQLRKIARDSGFTPKRANVRVMGRLVDSSGVPVLEVSGPNLRYVLADHPEMPGQLFRLTERLMGRDVVLTGELPEGAKQDDSPRLLKVESFVPREGR